MSAPVYIDKDEVISILRARQLDARADWVDRELPPSIDAYKNHALLDMLGIDPAAVAHVEAEAAEPSGPAPSGPPQSTQSRPMAQSAENAENTGPRPTRPRR